MTPSRRSTTLRARRPHPSGGRRWVIGVAAGVFAIVAAGCGSSGSTSSAKGDGSAVDVSLTDAGCKPNRSEVPAGVVAFDVTNDGASAVTEAELRTQDGQRILGEKENLTPGLSGSFEVRLAEGTYKVNCPGAKQDTWTLTVTEGDKVTDWKDNPALVKASKDYAAYVREQVSALVDGTTALATAVEEGDLDAAKRAYVTARLPYERIEPVAESFGDLDPQIDGRLGDNGNAPDDFIGFHRIERALWVDASLDGMGPIADELVANTVKLQGLVEQSNEYEPNQLASGALDLVNEVLTSKVSGEEERYSHIDLVDFQENLDGAMEVVAVLRPTLHRAAPDLLDKIDADARALQVELDTFKADPGYLDSGFVVWSCAADDTGHLPEGCDTTHAGSITIEQRRGLADAAKPLTESLSQVSVKVTR